MRYIIAIAVCAVFTVPTLACAQHSSQPPAGAPVIMITPATTSQVPGQLKKQARTQISRENVEVQLAVPVREAVAPVSASPAGKTQAASAVHPEAAAAAPVPLVSATSPNNGAK